MHRRTENDVNRFKWKKMNYHKRHTLNQVRMEQTYNGKTILKAILKQFFLCLTLLAHQNIGIHRQMNKQKRKRWMAENYDKNKQRK